MQENESLREFVKQFGQDVLQIKSYSMDVVLQIFKQSICPGTPLFEFLAKKPPTTMDDLFLCTDKYSMLEDDIWAATQQILVTGHFARNNSAKSLKPLSQRGPPNRRQGEQWQQTLLTPLTLMYEKLLPLIRVPFDFRWPEPLKTDPTKRDHNKKCAYHKDHGHTMKQCRSLHYLVERLLKVGHLKQYVRLRAKSGESSHHWVPRAPSAPITPRAIINYIHGGPWTKNTTPRERDRGCYELP